MKRRDFGIAGIAGLTAGLVKYGNDTAGAADKPSNKKRVAKPYGVQYYEKALEIWNRESSSELPLIVQAADKAAATLKNGKKLYSYTFFGHMLKAEFRPDRPGNPNYLPNWTQWTPEEEFDVVGDGDFLLFDYPRERVLKTRNRGAFTVGIRVPYLLNETTPNGVLANKELAEAKVFEEQDILMPEECADIILTSGVPFTDGALYVPEIPAVRPCPISPQGAGNFYWMLTAEIAMRDKGGGAMGTSEGARAYIELIKKRGAKIRTNIDTIDAVAKAMVEYVSRGARYWNYTYSVGNWNTTGQIMTDENIYRASGLSLSWPLKPEEIPEKGKAGDFVIIAGEASDVKENIDAARKFKSAGIKVIYIGPAHTEGSSGNDMSEVADWHIDTFSPDREGAVEINGIGKKICPTTGILYALSQYMLNAQFIGHMIDADMTPFVWMGMHLIGGKAYNDLVKTLWTKRGY